MAAETDISYGSFLDIEMVRRLSRISTAVWLATVLGNWTIIAGVIWLCHLWPYWPVYLGALGLIGVHQHGLGVLLHEGVHYRVATNRVWNDFLANYLTGYALLTPVQGYRAFHLKHHHLLDTPEDPERITMDHFEKEWSFPMSRGRLCWLLLRDLSGLWQKPMIVLLRLIWDIPGRVHHIVQIIILYGTITALLVATGHLWTYLLLWWVPMLTVFLAGFRFRTYAEHSNITAGERRYTREAPDMIGATRTTVGNPISRMLFAPHGINYHTEHHLYPSIPFFRLRKTHELLRANRKFAAESHICKGYIEVVRELTRTAKNR
jgi:fatty acid desaturase